MKMRPTITDQNMFDIAARHILKQGQPSIDIETNLCFYRRKDGYGCAMSPFIKDYVPEMEGKSFSGLIEEFSDKLTHTFFANQESLALDLQSCHDNAAWTAEDFMAKWKNAMSTVAWAYDLNNSVLEQG